MTTLDKILVHHGVKGQKWGIRRGRSASGSGHITLATAAAAKPKHGTSSAGHLPEGVHHITLNAAKTKHHSQDAVRFKEIQKKVKKHSIHSLSNEELQHLTKRFDLEQKFSKMAATQREKKKSPAGRTVSKIISKAADTTISEVGQALGKRASIHVLTKAKLVP